MKKNFAEPEMEVVRFSAQEILTASSGYHGETDCGNKELEFELLDLD